MFFKRKAITLSAILICVCLICFISPSVDNTKTASVGVELTPKIILDAGHGGYDGGAVAEDGTVEKDINLSIALKLSEFLKSSGFDVILTRNSDNSTDTSGENKNGFIKKSDLKNRLELMKNNPDAVFVSIHLNKFTTSAASGSQVFYSKNTEDSKRLGETIQNNIVKLLQPENKRVNKQSTSSTYLLHNATIPAVLVECGFLSNAAELKLLKTEKYQNEMAFCIFCGINDYFLKVKEI